MFDKAYFLLVALKMTGFFPIFIIIYLLVLVVVVLEIA